jgi:hypothetical protein
MVGLLESLAKGLHKKTPRIAPGSWCKFRPFVFFCSEMSGSSNEYHLGFQDMDKLF